MKLNTIAIVGLGLMGGSLAATCRRKFPRARIIGISRSSQALKYALKKRWIHEGSQDPRRAVKHADLIVLCTPVDTFPKFLSLLDRYAKRGALVTDVGSVKEKIVRWTKKRKFRHIEFVGAHPIAGSHETGIKAAQPHLYDKRMTFLIREKGVSAKSFRIIQSFWKKITPKVIQTSATKHDRIVGQVSHLAHAVAICLMLSVDTSFLRFAGRGFRDATRIAQGAPSIWIPIFLENRRPLLKSMTQFEKKMKRFRGVLLGSSSRGLHRMLTLAGQKRSRNSF